MSDVVSQLEVVIAGIEARIGHTVACCQHDVALDMQGERPNCICDRVGRVRSEIARVWLASLESANHLLSSDHAPNAQIKARTILSDEQMVVLAIETAKKVSGAAAFRATQEQETPK